MGFQLNFLSYFGECLWVINIEAHAKHRRMAKHHHSAIGVVPRLRRPRQSEIFWSKIAVPLYHGMTQRYHWSDLQVHATYVRL